MKKVYIPFSLFFLFLCCSCFKDQGNYDYLENEVISITGIQESYTAAQYITKLNIIPEITSNQADGEFDYLYTIYDMEKGSQKPDTLLIGQKDLTDYLVGLESKHYALIFRVLNKKTGIKAFYKSNLLVTTNCNNGWYVLKSEGEYCDMDYHSLNGEIAPNMLLATNGRQLDGDVAERISVNNTYADPNAFDPKTNTFLKTTVLFPVSNKDAKAVKLSTGKILNDFPQMFVEEPAAPYAPSIVTSTSMGQFIQNHGKAYTIFSYASLLSKFGVRLEKADFSDYRLSKYVVCNGMNDPVGFDELSSSFFALPANMVSLFAISDTKGTEMSAKNNNKTLLFSGCKAIWDDRFYAVFQDKTNTALKIISDINGIGIKSFMIKNDTLSTNDPAYHANIYTLNHSALKMMYFASDNKIYARNLASIPGNNEYLNITVAARERITLLKHIKNTTKGSEFDYLIVGTTSDGNYNLSCYALDLRGVPVNTQPIKTFKGKGVAGDISFVFPSISQTTFPLTY